MTPRIRGGRFWRGLVMAGLLALALPMAVTAHAELVRADPADGEVLPTPVTTVSARYSEDLINGSRLVIKDTSGATVGTGNVDPGNDRRMIARLDRALTGGSFTVESTARSADGHVERTTWSFRVAEPPTKSLPTPSPTASASAEPTATEAPTPSASGSLSPTASPAPIDPASGTGDVLLPIIAALAIVAVGAGFLLNRSRTPRP
ncbi:MAG TPA: copper resistance protein CopC [Candidatus Limnocylindrales bacterium]